MCWEKPSAVLNYQDGMTPLYIMFAHEMVHAYRRITGRTSSGWRWHYFRNSSGNCKEYVELDELYTVGFQEFIYGGPTENNIRLENGWKKRGAYKVNIDSATN
jgi:hypothetical protein